MKMILKYFLIWRTALFVFLFFSLVTVPLQFGFLGGGIANYLRNPQLFSWISFDGEHYLSIAQNGYSPLRYFYFPLYPNIITFVAKAFDRSMFSLAFIGILVSNAAFLVGLVGLTRLVKLDYSEKIVKYTIVLLLLFPTSFYFGSYYTEGLFFALAVWSFYYARKGNWILAGILGGLSTATRIVGLALIPALIVEAFLQSRVGDFREIREIRKIGGRRLLGILLIPAGLFIYMLFLKQQTGDPLEFLHSVEIFGEQRSSSFIMLPQVFYRYLFKIIPNINYNYFPVVFATWLELITALVFGGLGVLGVLIGFGKLNKIKFRLSYAIYIAFGYLIPTLSGSFSSLPRYVLVLFPAYLLMAIYLKKQKKYIQYAISAILFICLIVATTLFVRGYWVA
jgi:hypothetical protein